MNFGGIPGEYSQLEEAQIVVLPVPYDKTSTWMKGADKGPDALLEASVNLEWYDIDTGFEVYKKGIYTAESLEVDVSPPEMVSLVEKEVAQYIRNNKFVVTLGGEHSVSIGAAKAHSQYFDEVTVIQLDAHADLRDQYLDSPYNHACVMARIKEFAQVLQVGIRSMDISEKDKLVPGRFVYAKEVIENPKWEENILS